MDQVKQILAVMKKHHFWILTGLIAIVCSVGYVLARNKLTATIAARTSAIESAFTTVKGVQSEAPTHPNSNSHKQMDIMIKSISDDVKIAWEMQYNRQSKILVWPEEALPPDIKDQTLGKLKSLMPIETKLTFPPAENEQELLIMKERNVYRDYIEKRFPQLAKIVDADWYAKMRVVAGGGSGGMKGSSGGMGMGLGMGSGSSFGDMGTEGSSDGYGGMGSGSGMGSGMGMSKRPPGTKEAIVKWSPASQQELMDSICYWYNPDRPPTTMQICYTQEDLWILEGILRIIAATNDGAIANFQAAVKEIEFIRFGSSAMKPSGSVMMTGANPMGGMGGESSSGMGMGMEDYNNVGSGGYQMEGSSGDGGTGMGAEGGMGAAVMRDPADNRYVDDKFKPIPGATLRTSMQSSSPADAPFVVAKRIPVRMRFSKFDQRKLNKLIAECGSSGSVDNPRLILEVRQVRVNGAVASVGGMGGKGTSMGMGGGSSEMGLGMGSSGGLGSGSEGYGSETGSGSSGYGGTGAAPQTASSFDVPIEVYGVIYLYNPVDMEKLGLSNVTANTDLEARTEVVAETAPVAPVENTSAPATNNANPNVGGEATAPAENNAPAAPAENKPAAPASETPAAPAADAPAAPATEPPAAGDGNAPAAPGAGTDPGNPNPNSGQQ